MNIRYQLAICCIPLLLGGCAITSYKDREQPLKVFQNAHSGGSALAVNSSSTLLASGGWSGYLKIWSLPKGTLKKQWRAHSDSVTGILYGTNDTTVITAGYDGYVAVWTPNGDKIKRWKTTSPITAFAEVPNGPRIVTGHKDGWVRIWNVNSGELIKESQVQDDTIKSLSVSSNGQEIAVADDDADMALWFPYKSEIKRFEGSPSYSRSLAFSPDGKAVYGSGWFKLFRWSRDSGKLTVLDTEHHGIINSIRFTPDGNLATISRQTDSSVLVLDPKNGSTKIAYQKHDLCGGKITVSPDGCYMATNSDDASVRIWQLNPTCAMPRNQLVGSN